MSCCCKHRDSKVCYLWDHVEKWCRTLDGAWCVACTIVTNISSIKLNSKFLSFIDNSWLILTALFQNSTILRRGEESIKHRASISINFELCYNVLHSEYIKKARNIIRSAFYNADKFLFTIVQITYNHTYDLRNLL